MGDMREFPKATLALKFDGERTVVIHETWYDDSHVVASLIGPAADMAELEREFFGVYGIPILHPGIPIGYHAEYWPRGSGERRHAAQWARAFKAACARLAADGYPKPVQRLRYPAYNGEWARCFAWWLVAKKGFRPDENVVHYTAGSGVEKELGGHTDFTDADFAKLASLPKPPDVYDPSDDDL